MFGLSGFYNLELEYTKPEVAKTFFPNLGSMYPNSIYSGLFFVSFLVLWGQCENYLGAWTLRVNPMLFFASLALWVSAPPPPPERTALQPRNRGSSHPKF